MLLDFGAKIMFCFSWTGIAEQGAMASEGVFSCSLLCITEIPKSLHSQREPKENNWSLEYFAVQSSYLWIMHNFLPRLV